DGQSSGRYAICPLPLLGPLPRPGGQAARRGGTSLPREALMECEQLPTKNRQIAASSRPPWSRLLPRNAGGIVCCMPLSRTQPMPDLFRSVADHDPLHGTTLLSSVGRIPAVISSTDKPSPRYVLPKDNCAAAIGRSGAGWACCGLPP